MIDKKELIEFTADLVKVKSPFFEEDDITEFLKIWLKNNDFDFDIHEYKDDKITKFEGKNILCEIDGGNPGPTILFNGHMDTVLEADGWTEDPYGGKVEDGRLYGIGALDMKSGLAAMLMAVKVFKQNHKKFNGKIKLHVVSDEEGPFGLGTDAIINDGLCEADVAIVPEPSAGFLGKDNTVVCLGARGGVVYTVEITGVSAHAATPELGINAIVEMAKLIGEIDNIEPIVDEKLGKSSIAIINTKGGDSPASTADKAQFTVFKHIVRRENKETIKEEVFACADKAGVDRSRIKITFREAPSKGTELFLPYVCDENNKYIKDFLNVSSSIDPTTEIDYFPSMGDFNYLGSRTEIPTIVFGPTGKKFHSSDEYVDLESLVTVTEIMYAYLEKILL